ncbi:hypothetical protein [Metabacillus hrfriensis]|uniref:Uncharacterized protein n=1 Tax=Metabacillus hrfriensis TaxID=3048891 RepID=A0ACD4RIS7_9BACI|nr:hypothetical protein [Metabacillus sp. CT-WN-B3]WHZ60092.1 hypothetical protein QLQ22_12485 [Metabacillus sp. CT-WN-B3]
MVLSNLDAVKNVPESLEGKVAELRTVAEAKMKYYSASDRQEKTIELTNERTENPENVSIGMTSEEVLTKGWGRPQEINSTTTINGTEEQRVYPNFHYLYFEDGILVTIQN